MAGSMIGSEIYIVAPKMERKGSSIFLRAFPRDGFEARRKKAECVGP